MLHALLKIPACYLFHLLGYPRVLPINLTLSVTFNCNSHCKTCYIHQRTSGELSIEEWSKIFTNFGKGLHWATISGGEPFLRNDLTALICSLYDNCQPSFITIPTNGLLKERIITGIEQISRYCKKTQIIINLSIDDIKEKHDYIRGVPGNYVSVQDTLSALQSMSLPNITIGIHTVISKFNVDRISEIYRHLRTLNPDSYITEIAEEREELQTVGKNITPDYQDYVTAVDFLTNELKADHFNQVGNITRAFRIEYYRLVKRILKEKRQVIPCYTGFASAQIAPDGTVWACCTKAQSLGNLRDVEYDFKNIWFSEKATRDRQSIKDGKCYCPLANASYTNMLFNMRTLIRILWNLISIR